MALTAAHIPNLTCPENKLQIKKSFGNGLFLLIKSNNSKLWRFRYKYGGKHQEMAFGKYPTISLFKARELAENARILLSQGINPMEERRKNKRLSSPQSQSFESIALKWWSQQKNAWTDDNSKKVQRWLTKDCKSISKRAIDSIDEADITEIMQSLAKAGTPRKAAPILSVLNRVFGFGLAHRLVRTNPAQNFPLRDVIGPLPKVKHRAAITNTGDLAELIKSINLNQSGSFCSIEALKLIPHLFLRPKEIRFLKWAYIDFNDKLIRIPDTEMKRGREHLVPLSKQVLAQLSVLYNYTNYSEYVFPSERDGSKPFSKNVLVNRLRALGYDADIMSAHGFRSSASTILHEQGWDPEVIEAQLAHLIGSSTSRAYNRAVYLEKRKEMMQSWSDFLDKLSQTK